MRMWDINDRKQAQEKLQQQFEQQRLVMEMTQRIRRTLNLQDILQATVDEVRQFLGCDRVIIFQFSPSWGGTVMVESVASAWMAIPLQMYDPCIGEEYITPFREGLVTAKADIYTAGISPCHVAFLESLQVRANLVVPVLLGDELWGLLAVHHCTAPREWESSEIALLQQLGAQVSIAIQQAALFEQVQTELTERKQAQIALQELNAKLEQRVVQRTAQLRQANDKLLETVIRQQQTQLILLEQTQLLDLAHDTIITRDSNGVISFWNKGAESMYGWTKAEALGQISHIFLKTRFPQSLSDIEAELFKKGYWEGELIHFRWDDQPVHVASRWVLQKDNSDKPIKILEINNDITERKQAEAALQHYVHEIEDLYNNAPCGYHSLDPQGNVIRINDTELKWLGYTRDEILHKNFLELITSNSKQLFYKNFPLLKQQGWLSNLEFEIICKDGTIRWVSLNATAIKDEAGNFVMTRSTLFDISDRKPMEEALRASEQRYRSVIQVMAEGIVLQQSDGRITACNDSAERILGLTAEQMMGRTCIDRRWQAIHEDGTSFPGETHPAVVTLRTGKPQFGVIMGVHKPDGTLTWISLNSQPLFESDESKPYAVVTSFTDITDLKQVQIALQQQTKRERMVYAIAQHIRESLDLDEILNTTVTEVRQFLQTDRVIIYRINADGSGTVVTESVAFGWKPILNMEFRDTYFIEQQGLRSYQHGMIKVIPDIYTAGLTACHLELLENLQVRAKLIVPILQGDCLWGLLVAHHCSAPRQWGSSENELLQQLVTQVVIAIQQSELYQQLQLFNQQLENMAMVDQLTQIPNRRCFDCRLDFVWQYLLREEGFVSLLLCDIDYFKLYNDTYGHAAGDTCLKVVAQALKRTIKRSSDLVARYGGEEFVVILPNTTRDQAVQISQEIHAAIQQLNLPHTASAVKQYVTLSIGIATLIPRSDMVPLDLIQAADQALYQAKAQGRNRSYVSRVALF